MYPFGVAVNGVVFDPGAAEWWNGDLNWQYEPLKMAPHYLGTDASHAHVQPNGAYHYHGIPDQLLKQLKFDAKSHSPLVGWAADGFPIYCINGYSKPMDPHSEIKQLKSSYRLKSGDRPGSEKGPGGKYDGTFVEDYEFDAHSGDLDECNGRFCCSPEFSTGTYAYFLTKEWPVIPRAFKGKPTRLR